jgi:hypothetical protein
LASFEKDACIPAEFNDGYPDVYTIPALEKAVSLRGDTVLWSTATS